MPNSAERLRKILEDYTEWLPRKYWPILNYVSINELEKLSELRVIDPYKDRDSLYKRLYDAAIYWVERVFPGTSEIESHLTSFRKAVEDREMNTARHEAYRISLPMLMEMTKYEEV